MKRWLISIFLFGFIGLNWAEIRLPVQKEIQSRLINIICSSGDTIISYSNGIRISSDYIFVAAHSVKNKDRIFIKANSLIEINKEAIQFFDGYDFAVINVSGLNLPKIEPIRYGSTEKLFYGQTVICGTLLFYNEYNTLDFFMEGKICSIGQDFFLTDMKHPSGFSGSGIYDQKGCLIGLIIGSLEFGGEYFTCAYKIDILRRLILEKEIKK